jgi:hypothetical protein
VADVNRDADERYIQPAIATSVNRGFDELHSGEDLEAWLDDIGMSHYADALFDLNYTLLSDLRALPNSSAAYELGVQAGMRGLKLKAFAFEHWQQMVWTPTSYVCDCNGTESSRGYMGPECQTLMIPGCMDSVAINYNELANVDDGTCVIIVCEGDENPCGANADCFHTGPGVLTCACVPGCLPHTMQHAKYAYIHIHIHIHIHILKIGIESCISYTHFYKPKLRVQCAGQLPPGRLQWNERPPGSVPQQHLRRHQRVLQ